MFYFFFEAGLGFVEEGVFLEGLDEGLTFLSFSREVIILFESLSSFFISITVDWFILLIPSLSLITLSKSSSLEVSGNGDPNSSSTEDTEGIFISPLLSLLVIPKIGFKGLLRCFRGCFWSILFSWVYEDGSRGFRLD